MFESLCLLKLSIRHASDFQHHDVRAEPVKMSPTCSDVHIHPVHRTDGLLLVHISAVSHMKTAAAKGLKVGSRNPDLSWKTALCGRDTKNGKLLKCNLSCSTSIDYYFCHSNVLSWFIKLLLLLSPRRPQKYS